MQEVGKPHRGILETKIGIASLLVSVLSLFVSAFVTIFTAEIHDWFRLPGNSSLLFNWLAIGTGILGAIVGIVYASRLPKAFLKGWLLSALTSTLLIAGFSLGVALYRATEAAPLVLMGSSNVRAYLEGRLALHDMKPRWLDVGSGEGLTVLFNAFEYGTYSSRGNAREALVTLSSYGTQRLEQLFADASEDQTRENYWLSIRVAAPPLALIYALPEDKASKALFPKIEHSNLGKYDFVRCAELKKFFEAEKTGTISRHTPEKNTGTRAAFDAACGRGTKWPDSPVAKSKYPRQCIEDFTGPFVDLLSWVPIYCKTEHPATCDQLKQLKVKAAALCFGSCVDLARADHVLVMKLSQGREGHFQITNAAECRIAEMLTTSINHCELNPRVQVDLSHIARIDSLDATSPTVPDFLTCN